LPRSEFVNADEIAKSRRPEDPAGHSYDAARAAADALIGQGRPFTAETVFSHPSKLELVEAAAPPAMWWHCTW
jgi:predicted ABC-type ATPase